MADGRRQLLSVHLPGEICDLARIHVEEPSFGVIAMTECHVTTIHLSDVRALIDLRPPIRNLLWSSTTAENAAMIESVVGMGRRSPQQRVAYLMCDLLLRLEAVGKVEDDGFGLELRQSDIADLMGLSVVHTNRSIQDLKKKRLIGGSRKRFEVLDRGGLEDLAEFDRKAVLRYGAARLPPSGAAGSTRDRRSGIAEA